MGSQLLSWNFPRILENTFNSSVEILYTKGIQISWLFITLSHMWGLEDIAKELEFVVKCKVSGFLGS
jgi:hypothetical protein